MRLSTRLTDMAAKKSKVQRIQGANKASSEPGVSLEEKRKITSIHTLDQIPAWDEELRKPMTTAPMLRYLVEKNKLNKYAPSSALNKKVSLWHGDITKLKIDAIVNSVLGGQRYIPLTKSVFVAVCNAGGPLLEKECQVLLVIHAVTPGIEETKALTKCYQRCLELTLTHNIKSVAFCCIGTGGLGFPKEEAAYIALKTIREWLEVNAEKVERIIFCTYEQRDWDIYFNLLHNYFPIQHVEEPMMSSSKELEADRERKLEEERAKADLERENGRAAAAEQRLEHQVELSRHLQQQVEEQEQEINRRDEIIHQRENRIQELEQTIAEFQEREACLEQQLHQMERQVANSDRVFQDIFQRLLGQVPQSQPHWVVQREEIHLTEEQLGAGGWAVVKVAVFRSQRVAAKCLHNQIISAHNVRLFTREMNMAAHARHPNLLQFIGATMDNSPIILTELMPTSLRRVLEQGNPLSHRQIISIASDVARALNYLHLTTPDPIIHRDVSSANILLKSSPDDSYEAKLSDYGSANFVRYATTVGPGNPLYSAPEVNDPKQHSSKMDIYSFGLLLVEMCSGELFDDYEELIHTRISTDWPEMVAVICPCIRQDPRRRPSAADIISQLEQL